MQIVEYSIEGRLNRPLVGPRLVRTGIKTVEEGEAAIKTMLGDYHVSGYCQERDYHWGRKRAPSSPTILLKIEA